MPVTPVLGVRDGDSKSLLVSQPCCNRELQFRRETLSHKNGGRVTEQEPGVLFWHMYVHTNHTHDRAELFECVAQCQ